MTTQEIANRLVELCRTGQNNTAYQELFADDAVALEPPGFPNGRTEGKEALLAKSTGFAQSIQEMHDSWISEPVVAGNHFSVSMGLDITTKDRGRMKMEEICVYEVKDGKIVQEQFFFHGE